MPQHGKQPTHVRQPSLKVGRQSHPRLSLNPSPHKVAARTPARQLLSNPTSLDKKKPRVTKKAAKGKKKVEQPTQATLESPSEAPWKEHLKLTFR
jgi:hypothetical protein